MLTNDSVQKFVRAIEKNFNQLKDSLENFMSVLTEVNHDQKKASCKELMRCAELLMSQLDRKDFPAWLEPLRNACDQALANSGSSSGFKSLILPFSMNYIAARNHKWDFASLDSITPMNFDAIFQKHYQQSEMPKLFDQMIGHLQAIIDSKQVDLLSVIASLEKLIATIKKNRDGSSTAVFSTKAYISEVLKVGTLKSLADLPVVGNYIEAALEVNKKMDVDLEKVWEDFQAEFHQEVFADLPRSQLEGKPQLSLPSPVIDIS